MTFPLRYIGFTVPDELFAGYGLGLDERWRAYPDLHSVIPTQCRPSQSSEAALVEFAQPSAVTTKLGGGGGGGGGGAGRAVLRPPSLSITI